MSEPSTGLWLWPRRSPPRRRPSPRRNSPPPPHPRQSLPLQPLGPAPPHQTPIPTRQSIATGVIAAARIPTMAAAVSVPRPGTTPPLRCPSYPMSDLRIGPDQLREDVPRETAVMADGQRSLLTTGLALLGICVALFLAWKAVSSLLIIFAGVLFAALLDAAARAMAPVVRLNRIWRLTFVLLLLTAAIGLGLVWGADKLPEQTRLLLKVMDTQFDLLQQVLQPRPSRPWRGVELSDRRAGDRVPRHSLCLRSHQPP